jgi:hypothetical protein
MCVLESSLGSSEYKIKESSLAIGKYAGYPESKFRSAVEKKKTKINFQTIYIAI